MRKLNRSRLYEAIDENQKQKIVDRAVVHSSYFLIRDVLNEWLRYDGITDSGFDKLFDKCQENLVNPNTKAGKLLEGLVIEIIRFCKETSLK